MERRKERIVLVWGGAVLEVSYEERWLNMAGTYETAHIEVRVRHPKGARIPITDTGYRSHFLPKVDVDNDGSPEAYVISWLDLAAEDPEWQAELQASRQLSLF